MKPYKLIKSNNPLAKRYVIVEWAKPPKRIPMRLFSNVHPPKKVEFIFE